MVGCDTAVVGAGRGERRRVEWEDGYGECSDWARGDGPIGAREMLSGHVGAHDDNDMLSA